VSLPAERSVIVDEEVVAVSVPLPALRYALRGLAVQPTLSFPARFLLTPEHGPALRAEIPRLLPLRECKELAHQALDEAVLEAARPRALSNGPAASCGAPTGSGVRSRAAHSTRWAPSGSR
jgi:hypothetical protein